MDCATSSTLQIDSLDLGAPGEHPGHAHGGEDEGECQRFAEHRAGEIPRRHVAQDPLAESDGLEVLGIGPHGCLFVSSAIDVVEELAGESATGQLSVVPDGARS